MSSIDTMQETIKQPPSVQQANKMDGWSSEDERLALQAYQMSDRVLQEIQHAQLHIEQTFRVQIKQNAQDGQVSEQEKMALELILGRLQSLKTTIQVDQFFPRAYFQTSSTSLPHNCANGSTEIEPSQTWPTLRNFSKKYAYLDTTGTGSWATHTLKELDNYQVYDAVDIRNYYSLQQQSVEPNDGEPEGNENPSGSKPHRVASLEEVELQTETEKPVHDGAQMAHAAPKKKSKLKSVLGFGSKKNKGAGRL